MCIFLSNLMILNVNENWPGHVNDESRLLNWNGTQKRQEFNASIYHLN